MNKDYSCLDGEVLDFDAQLAMSPVRGGQYDTDLTYNASGITNLLTTKEGRKRRQAARAERRSARIGAKKDYAAAQKIAAKGMSQDSAIDKAVAESLTTKPKKVGSGSSMTTWLLVGGGVLAVAVVGFMVYKKMKKK